MLEDIADKEFLEILGKTPVMLSQEGDPHRILAIPDGEGGFEIQDMSRNMLAEPDRKKTVVNLTDANSFISYVNRHKRPSLSTVWVGFDINRYDVTFHCVFDDDGADSPQWRDHVAHFNPLETPEFKTWMKCSNIKMCQKDFAVFLEDNITDIVSKDGSPSAADILNMALHFESRKTFRIKSDARLEDGSYEITMMNKESEDIIGKMQVFSRFYIGIPVFFNGQAYYIEARLRYRADSDGVAFWYELVRPEKVLEDAVSELIVKIREACGLPVFFGEPFSQ